MASVMQVWGSRYASECRRRYPRYYVATLDTQSPTCGLDPGLPCPLPGSRQDVYRYERWPMFGGILFRLRSWQIKSTKHKKLRILIRYGFLMFVYLQVRKYLFSSERQYFPSIQPMGAGNRAGSREKALLLLRFKNLFR